MRIDSKAFSSNSTHKTSTMNKLIWLSKQVVLFAAVAGNGTSFAQLVASPSGGPPRPVVGVVTITSSDPRPASSQTISHKGKCANLSFEMNITHDVKRVQFILEGARQPLDLSESKFGKTYFTRPLTGFFSFTCLQNTLYVKYQGLELMPGMIPRSFSYLLALDFKGTVQEDRGLAEDSLDSVRRSRISALKLE